MIAEKDEYIDVERRNRLKIEGCSHGSAKRVATDHSIGYHLIEDGEGVSHIS